MFETTQKDALAESYELLLRSRAKRLAKEAAEKDNKSESSDGTEQATD